MIRDKILIDLTATLDKHSKFDNSLFTLDTKWTINGVILKIVYKLEVKYYFEVTIPNSIDPEAKSLMGKYHFNGIVCPGPVSLKEQIVFHNLSDLYNSVFRWLDCIWEELSANPIVKELEKQKDDINKIFEKIGKIPDEPFTKEEVEKLKERLDGLQKQYEDSFEQIYTEKNILKEKLEELKRDVDALKTTASVLKKAGWIKTYLGKVYKWGKDEQNRKLLKDIVETTKLLLPQ